MGRIVHPDTSHGIRTNRIVVDRIVIISGEVDPIFFIIRNNVVVDVVR
jgi:hypothetical protein